MEPREYLRGDGESGGRFRIQELAAAGRTCQVVRCVDTEAGNRSVCAKAPLYESYEGETTREARRRAAEFEVDVLDFDIGGFPDAVELIEVEGEDSDTEPVVVLEWIDGTPVRDFVAKRPREVLDPETLLGVVREVGERLVVLHDRRYLFRDLDPRHVLVDASGSFAGFAGTGNIAALGETPIRPASDYADAPYVAPEARQERSGETMRPAADVYGMAAFLAYLLTGEEPTSAVESPLTGRGYEELKHIEPAGLRHLVAAGLQPVAKNRVSLETFVDRAQPDRLPESNEPLLASGDSIQPLPPPWSGADPPGQNRAARSSISSGPLISVDRGGPSSDLGGDSTDESAIQGVKSDPVREFMGERDEVGGESGGSESEDGGDVRRRDDGTPAREVSMVRENVGDDSEETSPDATDSGLPDLADLPLRTRLFVGVGIPLAVIAAVVLFGLLGLY